MRRRAPAVAALVAVAIAGTFAILTTFGPGWLVSAGNGYAGTGIGIFLSLAVAFSVARLLPVWAGVAATLVLVAAFQVSAEGFNPFLIVVPGAAWLVGVILRDRSRLRAELERTGRRLRDETALLAEESVRYERARIARELHDIVAHCVSVMVVQAYAGERLSVVEPERAAASFDHILGAATQAKLELRRLVELLDEDAEGAPARLLLPALHEIRERAAATGLTVELRACGDIDDLPPLVSAAVFRAVQEGVTNALKHAPGAPLRIDVDRTTDRLCAAVTNGPATALGHAAEPYLLRSGGGYGLEGMRGRLEALGGTLAAGPDAGGGWVVEASVPLATTSLMSNAPGATLVGPRHRPPLRSSANANRPHRLFRMGWRVGGVSSDAAQPGGPIPPR